MAGSPKKPADRRQGRGTADMGLVEATRVVEIPDPPHPAGSRLRAETVVAWESFWRSELASLAKESDHPALVRLFRMYDMRASFEAMVLAQPMVAGSKGQPRVNPITSEIASLDSRIVALEDRFGLSPAARLKLGVTFGAAARSLEELNREFERGRDNDEGDDEDPRLRVIDTTAS